jgi:hypothetical protein
LARGSGGRVEEHAADDLPIAAGNHLLGRLGVCPGGEEFGAVDVPVGRDLHGVLAVCGERHDFDASPVEGSGIFNLEAGKGHRQNRVGCRHCGAGRATARGNGTGAKEAEASDGGRADYAIRPGA